LLGILRTIELDENQGDEDNRDGRNEKTFFHMAPFEELRNKLFIE